MMIGTGLALWGLLFICAAIAVAIGSVFGIIYSFKNFHAKKSKSIFILASSLLFFVPIMIFFLKIFLPKQQVDASFDFVKSPFDNNPQMMCKQLTGLDNEYYCNSEFVYNLVIHFPNNAEFRVKAIHLDFSIYPENKKLRVISFFNKSTYSKNQLKNIFNLCLIPIPVGLMKVLYHKKSHVVC